jgi:hypothetical protein
MRVIAEFWQECFLGQRDRMQCVESWPHEVKFSEDDTTHIVRMQLRAREQGWAQTNEVYVQQTPTTRSPEARG